jgi:hypothetical protein
MQYDENIQKYISNYTYSNMYYYSCEIVGENKFVIFCDSSGNNYDRPLI